MVICELYNILVLVPIFSFFFLQCLDIICCMGKASGPLKICDSHFQKFR